jgi:hypothetical protein
MALIVRRAMALGGPSKAAIAGRLPNAARPMASEMDWVFWTETIAGL